MPEVERLKVTLEADNKSFKRGMADSSRTAAQHSEKIRKEAASVKSSMNPIIGEIRKINSSIKQSAGASAIEKMKKGFRDWQIKVGLKVKTEEYKGVESELAKMEKRLSGLNLAGRIMQNRGDDRIGTSAYNKLSADIKEAEKSLQGLIAAQEKLIASGNHEEWNPRYQELEKQADEQRTSLDSLREKLAHSQFLVRTGRLNNDSGMITANEKNVKAYEAEIEKLEKELERTYSEMEKMEDSGKMTVPTAEAKSLAEQIEAAKKHIGELKSEMASLKAAGKDHGTDEWIRNQEAIKNCTEEIRALEQEKQKMEAAGSDVTAGSFRNWGAAAKEAARNVKKSLDGIIGVIRRTSGAFASLLHRFRNGISAVKSFAGSVAKSISGIRGLGSASNGTSIDIGNLAKSLLRYGIGIRSLFALFNKIRGAIVDGFENLAQADSGVNQSISMLMSSLTELKNSLAAAFTPILETIAPILNGLIRMLITAANAVGQFFGALTGKGYYIQAKAVNEDYAASLQNAAKGTDNLGNNADNANESVKDLKRTLAGFDEITKLDDTSDKSGSGNTGNTGKTGNANKYGISPGDMFERVNIDSGINDIAQMIKDAFMNKDWEGIGRMIADLLWKGVKKLGDLFDPDFINPKIDEFTTAVAGIINGFFDPDNDLWHGLGGALGNILNAAVRTANGLWDKVNFENIGKSLGMSFNDLIQKLDAYEMGRLVMQKFNAVLDFAKGFLEQNKGNFTSWGKKFEDFLMGALDMIKPKKIAEVINLAVSGAINFIGGVGWNKLGKEIGKKLGELIDNIDADNIGHLISKVITSGLDLAKGFLESMRDKWSTLGTKVGSMLATALNDIQMGDIEQVLSDAMTGALDFLGNAVDKFMSDGGFLKVGEAIAAGLNGVLGNPENWNKLGDLMHDLLIGALQILQKIRENFHWEDVSNAIHDSIKKVIDDESWDEAFEELSLWVEDICTFINDALPTEAEWKKIGTRISELLQTIPWKSVFGTVIRAIINMVKGLWEGLGSTFAGHIIQGIIVFKISYGLLSPFFSGIGDIIKGEIVNRLIGGRIKTMLGSGLTKGATDAAGIVSGNVGLGLFSSAIGSALLSAGGIIAGGVVFLDACKLFAQGIDLLGGGNGQISETGSAWHDFASQLSESKAITSDEKDEIDKLIESMESSNATTEEMGTAVTQALSDAGVSASEYKSAMESTATQISTTAGQFDEMNRNLGKFGEGVSQTKDTIDMSVPSMSDAFGGIRDVLFDMYSEGIPGVSDGFSNLDYVLNQVQTGSAPDAQSALDAIVMTLGQDSEAAQIFMDKMKEKFPEAVVSGATQSSAAMDETKQSINESLKGIEKQASTTGINVKDSLVKNLRESRTEGGKELGEISATAKLHLGNVAKAANENGAKAKSDYVGHIIKTKTDSNRELGEISAAAKTNFEKVVRSANDNGVKAKSDYVRSIAGAKSESDRELSAAASSAERHLSGVARTAKEKAEEAKVHISDKFGVASKEVDSKTGAMNTDTYKNMQLQFGQVKFFTDNMSSYIDNEWKKISRNMSSTIMPDFKDAVGTGMMNTLTAVSGFVGRISDKVGELSGKLSTKGSEAGQSLKDGLTSVDFGYVGSSIVNSITSAFDGIGTSLWQVGYNAIANIQNGMNTAGLKVPHVGWDWQTVYYGDNNWVQVPNFNVQWYAKGGLFKVPTIAGFGEAGDEAALPLTDRSVMSRIANAIVDAGGVGNSLSRDDMIEAVATGVAMAMAQNPQTVEVVVQSVLKADDEKLAQAVSRGQARLDQRYNATPAYGY